MGNAIESQLQQQHKNNRRENYQTQNEINEHKRDKLNMKLKNDNLFDLAHKNLEEKDPKIFARLQRKNFDEFMTILTKSRGLFNNKIIENLNIGVTGPVSEGKTSFLRILTTNPIIYTVDEDESTRVIPELCSLKLDKSAN